MPIRLLAIDLDGTLVNDRLEIDARDVAAVRAATAAGVHVVIATGRMFRSSLPYAEQLGLTGPIINYQGAVVRDISSGEVLYKCELTVAMQRRVLEYVEPRDWHVNVYVDERVYTARARPEADLYQKISMVPYEVVGPLSSWIRRESTKMVLVDLDPDDVPARMAERDGVAVRGIRQAGRGRPGDRVEDLRRHRDLRRARARDRPGCARYGTEQRCYFA